MESLTKSKIYQLSRSLTSGKSPNYSTYTQPPAPTSQNYLSARKANGINSSRSEDPEPYFPF